MSSLREGGCASTNWRASCVRNGAAARRFRPPATRRSGDVREASSFGRSAVRDWVCLTVSRVGSFERLKESCWSTAMNSWRLGMRTSEPRAGEKIKAVRIDEDTLTVDLADGRTVSTPLAWYPRLLHATPEQRDNFVISPGGFGIHW